MPFRDLTTMTHKSKSHITPLSDPKGKCMSSEINPTDNMTGSVESKWKQQMFRHANLA